MISEERIIFEERTFLSRITNRCGRGKHCGGIWNSVFGVCVVLYSSNARRCCNNDSACCKVALSDAVIGVLPAA